MKKKNNLKSLCCNAKVKISMSPDFFGDNPKNMIIGTCYYICTKCNQACDIYSNSRKIWNRNPKTQIQKDKREKIKNKIINKEVEQIGNA
jgi:hypothetical protein